jgi:hypothetical protein
VRLDNVRGAGKLVAITQEETIGRNPSGGSGTTARCAAIKAGGEPCKALPVSGSEWCWSHHPDNRQKHAKNGSKGGREGWACGREG